MSFDIVCFYADLGRDYEPLLTKMVASAKRTMPNAQIICTTPTPNGKIGKGWHHVVPLPDQVTFENICIERARMTVSWMIRAQRPVIFTDPDIEFINPVKWDGLTDVNLLWRTNKPDQPVNEGL